MQKKSPKDLQVMYRNGCDGASSQETEGMMGSLAMKPSTRTKPIVQTALHRYKPDIRFLKGEVSPDAWSVVARTKLPNAPTNVSDPNQSIRKNISRAV
jgi:hypothetical protein